jgi:hypothetical protein
MPGGGVDGFSADAANAVENVGWMKFEAAAEDKLSRIAAQLVRPSKAARIIVNMRLPLSRCVKG